MASALKSVSAVPPELFGGEGTAYADKYREVEDAENQLMELLKTRRGGGSEGFRLDPTMLALAGELLDPGRTGSFGEALGRGAKAYSVAQQAEEKNRVEDLMAQMQLSGMGLERERRRQAMGMLSNLPAAPEGGVGPVKGDESGPALMIRGQMVTPATIAKLKLVDKDMGEAFESAYKLQLETEKVRQDRIGSQPSGTFDKITGEFRPFPGAEGKREPVPEIQGELIMSPEDIKTIRQARSKGDAKTVYEIIDRNMQGVGARPTTGAAPEVKPAEVPTEAGDMTTSGREARGAAKKTAAETMAKDAAERTSKFIDTADANMLARAAAAQNLEIARKNPKIFGFFNKPGVSNAIMGLLQESADSHVKSGQTGVDVNISRADLSRALMKVDPSFKIEDFTGLDVFIGNLARLELGLRKQTYAGSGMGHVSNLEGQPIKDVLGSRYDTPEAIMRKMMGVGRAFDFDSDVADAFRKYTEKPGNEFKTLEQFKKDSRDGTYVRLRDGFERWLNSNLGIPFKKTTKESPAAAPMNKNSVMEEIERRKKQR